MKCLDEFGWVISSEETAHKEASIKLGLIFHPLDVHFPLVFIYKPVRQCRLCHYSSEEHGMHVMDFMLLLSCIPQTASTVAATEAQAAAVNWWRRRRRRHHHSIWYVARLCHILCALHKMRKTKTIYSAFYVFLCVRFATKSIRFIDLWQRAHSTTNSNCTKLKCISYVQANAFFVYTCCLLYSIHP